MGSSFCNVSLAVIDRAQFVLIRAPIDIERESWVRMVSDIMPLTAAPNISNKWITDALARLAEAPWGYHATEPSAAEPTALAALALMGAGRSDQAQPHLKWLAAAQTSAGSIAPFEELTQSAWPTSLAIVAVAISAHAEFKKVAGSDRGSFDLSQAKQWLLTAAGTTMQNSPEIGHNGQLVGWPWVIGTHSWQEPTAWSVMALKALGMSDHPRAREGIKLLVDRLLATGGCNFGNTIVLGQTLRPQVEPTGVTLLALAGEKITDPRIEFSLQYLIKNVSVETTPISLSYGLLGLTAHDRRPSVADEWLEAAYRRASQRNAGPLVLALLVLAAQGKDCPLIKQLVI
jgi:hypothetical protein